jgi:hypothetical protein
VQHAGQLVEIFTLQDGGEICFDVTTPMALHGERLEEELALVANG